MNRFIFGIFFFATGAITSIALTVVYKKYFTQTPALPPILKGTILANFGENGNDEMRGEYQSTIYKLRDTNISEVIFYWDKDGTKLINVAASFAVPSKSKKMGEKHTVKFLEEISWAWLSGSIDSTTFLKNLGYYDIIGENKRASILIILNSVVHYLDENRRYLSPDDALSVELKTLFPIQYGECLGGDERFDIITFFHKAISEGEQ